MLPPGFALSGEPVVSVSASYITEIEWLAGRGYNTLGVSFPARYQGEQDQAEGKFLLVLWENLTDPNHHRARRARFFQDLLRTALPHLPHRATYHIVASWLGYRFLDLHVSELKEQTQEEIVLATENTGGDGLLHYKYLPRTGAWGTADIAYATLTPAATPNRRILERQVGSGEVVLHPARWEDMPTQYNIVNALAALPIREYRGASLTKTIGGKDISDQRILR